MLRLPLVAIAAVVHSIGHGACMLSSMRSMSCIGRSAVVDPIENVAVALGLRFNDIFKIQLRHHMGNSLGTLTLPTACAFIANNARMFVSPQIVDAIERVSAPLEELYDSEEEDDNYALVPLRYMDNILHQYYSNETTAHALTILSGVIHELSGGFEETGIYNACRAIGLDAKVCRLYAAETKKFRFLPNEVRHPFTMAVAVAALAVSKHSTPGVSGPVIKMDTGHTIFFETLWMHAASIAIGDRQDRVPLLWERAQDAVLFVKDDCPRPVKYALIAESVWSITHAIGIPLNNSAWLAWQAMVYRCGLGLYDIPPQVLLANDGAKSDWGHEARSSFLSAIGLIGTPLVGNYSYFRRLHSHINDLIVSQEDHKLVADTQSTKLVDEFDSNSLLKTVARCVELAIHRSRMVNPANTTILYIGYREMFQRYWRNDAGILPLKDTMDISVFLEKLLESQATTDEIQQAANAFKLSRESDRITFEDASTIYLLHMASTWSGDISWRNLKRRLGSIGVVFTDANYSHIEGMFSSSTFVNTRIQRLIQLIGKSHILIEQPSLL